MWTGKPPAGKISRRLRLADVPYLQPPCFATMLPVYVLPVAALAGLLPARRAAALDPALAIRGG